MLLFQARIKPDEVHTLDAELRRRGFPFERYRTIHYARWVILPTLEAPGQEPIPATLLLSVAHDGDGTPLLRAFAEETSDWLDAFLGHCEGYPEPADRTAESRLAYLKAHRLRHGSFYVGAPRRTVEQIRCEAHLHAAIQDFLDTRSWHGVPPEEVHATLRRHFFEERAAEFGWAQVPPPPPLNQVLSFVQRLWGVVFVLALLVVLVAEKVLPSWTLLLPLPLLGFGLALLLLLVLPKRISRARIELIGGPIFAEAIVGVFVAYGALPGWVLLAVPLLALGVGLLGIIRLKEISEDHRAPLYRVDEFETFDDPRAFQMPVSHLVPVRPGLLRRLILSIVLRGVELMCRCFYTLGEIGAIRTIHFAHWTRVDDGRRLTFLSNFDGSWKLYLAETSDDLAAAPLSALWSNTAEFPPTRWLVYDGARDVDSFEAWTAKHQVDTQIWYSAYPTLSLRNIQQNTFIRRGLAEKTLRDEPLNVWLRYL